MRITITILVYFLAPFCFAQEGQSAVRIIHLSPDAPLVDLVIDDTLTFKDLEFEEASSYFLIPAGRHDIKVFPHRAPKQDRVLPAETTDTTATDDSSPAQPTTTPRTVIAELEPLTIPVELNDGAYYTIAVVGYFDPPASEATGGQLIIETDDETRVQVEGPRGLLFTLEKPQTLKRLEPGTYTLTASKEGHQSAQYEVTISSGEVTTLPIVLQSGDDTDAPTLAPVALPEEQSEVPTWHRTTLQLYQDNFPGLPGPGQAFVRIVHTAPAINAVDVSIESEENEGSIIAEGLTYPNTSDYLALSAGRQDLTIFLSGTDFPVSSVLTTNVPSGTLYTLYLIGSVNDQTLTPLPTIDAILRSGR